MNLSSKRVNYRDVFLRNEEIRLRAMSYVDNLTVGEILQPVYRAFLARLVARVLREMDFESACAARFDLGEIPDFMG
jgi:hypothetical protein